MSDPMSTKTQFNIEQLLARGRLYQALAHFLRHPALRESQLPDEEKIVEWQEAVEIIKFPEAVQLKNCLKLLVEELKKTDREAWIRQYEQCFGHTAMGPVPLYELEYGEEESLRQPHQLADISAFYHAFGLHVNKKIYERVDHAGVECEFVQYLLFKEAYALDQKQEENALTCRIACYRFILEHLGRWFPSFGLRLEKCAQTGLMKRIADFAMEFVTQDCQTLNISPGPYDLPVRSVQEREEISCLGCSPTMGCGDNEHHK